jgi:predicted dienelactone hydrolase
MARFEKARVGRALVVFACIVVLASALASTDEPPAKQGEARPARYHIGYRLVSVPQEGQEDLPVAIWYPTDVGPGNMRYQLLAMEMASDATPGAPPARGPFPLVIFSHGAGCSATTGAALAEALAEDGFVVAGPDHSDEFVIARSGQSAPSDPDRVRKGLEWAAGVQRAGTKFAHRPKEVRMTIDYVLAESASARSDLHGLVDPDKIGVMGVSFGAWTAAAVAGFQPVFRDERVRAAVPIAGTVGPSLGSFANVRVPVMIVFGERETVRLLDPTSPSKTEGMKRTYQVANAPRYLVGIAGAGHMQFGGAGASARTAGPGGPSSARVRAEDPVLGPVNRYCVAFFRRYLKDDGAAAAVLAQPGPGVFLFEADPGETREGAPARPAERPQGAS